MRLPKIESGQKYEITFTREDAPARVQTTSTGQHAKALIRLHKQVGVNPKYTVKVV